MLKKLTFLFIASCILSCDSENLNENTAETDFNSSLQSWETLKTTHLNSYRYTVSTKTPLGHNAKTTITVNDGCITSRTYEVYSQYDDNNTYLEFKNRIVLNRFYEDANNIETHACNDNLNHFCNAAPALTIDELYNTCLQKYLKVNAATKQITFSVNDENLIKACYYNTQACEDDCFFGIKISDFEWLNNN